MVRQRGRRRSLPLLACAIAAVCSSTYPQLRAAAPDPAGGTFELVARHSGKCLDITGVSVDDLARAIQWDCHGGANQQWTFQAAGDGYYVLTARHSGKALTVLGESIADGALVGQYTPMAERTSSGACSPRGAVITR